MPWYYANNNQRLGPVNDAEFVRLAREKIIREDTLVWKYGMPDWKPYAEVEATLPPPEVRPAASVEPSDEDIRPAYSAENVTAIIGERLNYAGFWVRVMAKLIDLIILNVLVMIVAKLIGAWHEPPPIENFDQLFQFLDQLKVLGRIAFVIGLFYQWFFLKRLAATPGKLLLGIKVVRADGSPLSHGRIVGRYFAEILNQFTLFLGYFVVAFDDEKRSIQDHVCDTRVVYKRKD